MPRSFSRSLESMTRSTTASLERKVPDWRSIASTSVVLPWSTWAMMAMLRMGWAEVELLTAECDPYLVNESEVWNCAGGATGTHKPFKAEKYWKSAPDSVYRRKAVAVAR